jgi:hypothetical protein
MRCICPEAILTDPGQRGSRLSRPCRPRHLGGSLRGRRVDVRTVALSHHIGGHCGGRYTLALRLQDQAAHIVSI